jgi:glutamate/aspartate transport system substrate-binding protein
MAMMRLHRFLIVSLAMALFVHDAVAQESLTLKKVKETEVITIGYRVGSIPFSYLDNKQRPIGYSMDLCDVIVEAVKARLNLKNLEVKYIPVTAANRMPLVGNDIVDLECGSTTNTVERQKKVSFTVTTFVAAGRLVSKKSSNITSIEDLKGRPVVSSAGTTSVAVLTELNRSRNLGMRVLVAKDHNESFKMVNADRAVAFLMDDVILHGLVASTMRPQDYVISDESLSNEPYGIIVRKDDPEFKSIADNALIDLFKSGEINRIYRKWFQSPIPPWQINLQMPMNDALKKAIANPADSVSLQSGG